MRVGMLVANGLVLGAIGWMASLGGTEQRAAELFPKRNQAADAAPADFQGLEARAALAPSTASVAALAGAYLDRGQPGLATAVIENAPREMQQRPEIAQLHARALFHRGHVRDALAVARDASESCSDSATCAPWLVAKTTRQVAFFEQVVAAGIEDPISNPDATLAAYDRSSHEVRLVAMR
jgi:hypothetical protein